MTALTPSDLARLRVRLDELPGFDPVGLFVYGERGDDHMVVFADDDDLLVHDCGSEDLAWWWSKSEGPRLDLADASTADRVARWVAERHRTLSGEPPPGCTAPSWFYEGGRWVLSTGGWSWLVPRDLVTEPTELQVQLDRRRLRDGSRWVDRAALAEVARHVGRKV